MVSGPGSSMAIVTTSVVTGGAGFLGSHLCDYLIEQGHRVICVDNLETGSLENVEHLRDPAFSFVYQDVVDGIWIEEPVTRTHVSARSSIVSSWSGFPMFTGRCSSLIARR